MMFEIMPCGTKAKTVNPLGKKPTLEQCDDGYEYLHSNSNWEAAENNRQEFEIDFGITNAKMIHPSEFLIPFSIVKGEIVNNKVVIKEDMK